jgi:hypothetical protein
VRCDEALSRVSVPAVYAACVMCNRLRLNFVEKKVAIGSIWSVVIELFNRCCQYPGYGYLLTSSALSLVRGSLDSTWR